jgi:uncharacterized protein
MMRANWQLSSPASSCRKAPKPRNGVGLLWLTGETANSAALTSQFACVLPWQNEGGMTLESLRRASRDTILATAASHGAGNVRVFGSVARGEADALSDLDLLVDMDHDRSLMDIGGLLMDLQAQLNTKVDVATERMLRREIRERVLSEAIPL